MSETIKAHAVAVVEFNYDDNAPRGEKILLLTEGRVTVPGIWQDHSGIVAWAGMPKVDQAKFEAALQNPHSGIRKPTKGKS